MVIDLLNSILMKYYIFGCKHAINFSSFVVYYMFIIKLFKNIKVEICEDKKVKD